MNEAKGNSKRIWKSLSNLTGRANIYLDNIKKCKTERNCAKLKMCKQVADFSGDATDMPQVATGCHRLLLGCYYLPMPLGGSRCVSE